MIKHPKDLHPVANQVTQDCFGCGASNAHGLQMKFFTDNQQVYSFLEVPRTMTGWNRIVHGGVVSTILDETMAWAAIHLFGQLGVTQSITVEFKKPVRCGVQITSLAGIRKKISESAVSMFGRIYDADENLCAQATGLFKMIKPKTAMRMGIVGSKDIATFGPTPNFDDETS